MAKYTYLLILTLRLCPKSSQKYLLTNTYTSKPQKVAEKTCLLILTLDSRKKCPKVLAYWNLHFINAKK